MRRKEIKFGLVYRDMWQSSGKYMPRAEQLKRVAEPIIEMGCFARVETNGGGFEQINLLFGENPNHSVRRWTKPFRKAGIQTHMLERGLNALRMSPVPLDVRRLMFKVKKIQGTDISRSFDGLNSPENLAKSFEFAREGGMIAQGALSLTVSPVHTEEYFIRLADKFIDLGAEEICLKDMAGIARPASVGRIVNGIRKRHQNILITYHGHSSPGLSLASSLEAARNGADIIDVGMEPLSWGTGHADLISVREALLDDGFLVPDVNMSAYMEVRRLNQEFIDDFLGYYMDPKNRHTSSLLLGPGLPGGMMGSLMADLKNNLSSLNKWLSKNGKPEMSQDELLIKMFEEVEYAWPKLGYPPLVTPYSQYVKNVALTNAILVIKGKERWSMLDENTWDMILGKAGQLPGPVADEIKELAKSQGREFYTGDPQSLYPDCLNEFRTKMDEKGWDTGEDDEELFEYAMHPQQYEAYKSGEARKKFLQDLQSKKEAAQQASSNRKTTAPAIEHNITHQPKELQLQINGEIFNVSIKYPANGQLTKLDDNTAPVGENISDKVSSNGISHLITSPLEGKFYLTKDPTEKGIQIGDKIRKGDVVGYIESMKVLNAITSAYDGLVTEIAVRQGEDVEEDMVIVKLN